MFSSPLNHTTTPYRRFGGDIVPKQMALAKNHFILVSQVYVCADKGICFSGWGYAPVVHPWTPSLREMAPKPVCPDVVPVSNGTGGVSPCRYVPLRAIKWKAVTGIAPDGMARGKISSFGGTSVGPRGYTAATGFSFWTSIPVRIRWRAMMWLQTPLVTKKWH